MGDWSQVHGMHKPSSAMAPTDSKGRSMPLLTALTRAYVPAASSKSKRKSARVLVDALDSGPEPSPQGTGAAIACQSSCICGVRILHYIGHSTAHAKPTVIEITEIPSRLTNI